MPQTRRTAAASPSRRSANGGETRRRDADVIAAATKVFYERGYADATVQDVADELGILKGSLYHYIDTKEDLLYRLLVEVHEEVDEILQEVVARSDLGPLERLALYVRLQVDYNARNLAKVAVYHHDFDLLGEARRREVYARRHEHEAVITNLIVEAQQTGDADATLDAETVAKCIFGTVIWMYRWYRPRGKLKREDLVDTAERFILQGVVGRP
jgi:AcrR family transcriptional regulator